MTQLLESGSLWKKIRSRTESAIAKGALHSIPTDFHILQQYGLEFMVRVAQNLKRKALDKARQTAIPSKVPFNPFLPPEPEMTVADITPTHLSVLNKFNVVENHLLIVTRDFQHQEHLLTLADFEALWICLREYPSLGFYNGGAAAGASQQHKHLQLVPLPLYQGHSGTPFDSLYTNVPPEEELQSLKQFPFRHCWSALPGKLADNPSEAAKRTLSRYLQMLKWVGIDSVKNTDGNYQSAPYNLLLTREWMLLVPRSQECYKGISINALGYVGSLFVKEMSELETVKRKGPMNLLEAVSIAA
ncbi:MAG: Ap4A phosphorylase II [Candidatus Thiodiazotropha sp.]